MKRAHSSWPTALNVHEAWIVSCRLSMSWLMSNVVLLPSPTKHTRPQVAALRRAVGGAGPARDRGALFEAERVGQGHERARRHLHVRRVPAVTRHAVDDDAVRTEL